MHCCVGTKYFRYMSTENQYSHTLFNKFYSLENIMLGNTELV
jgi:hypothetical protein